jgi:hypothetical protein
MLVRLGETTTSKSVALLYPNPLAGKQGAEKAVTDLKHVILTSADVALVSAQI